MRVIVKFCDISFIFVYNRVVDKVFGDSRGYSCGI